MTTETITFFNAALHSLICAALGWLVVYWLIRDARRRALGAVAALIVSVIAPWTVPAWALPQRVESAPALQMIHQALQPQWGIQVDAAPVERIIDVIEHPPASPWDINEVAAGVWWIWLLGACVMVLRHLGQCCGLLRWRARLRGPTRDEMLRLPAGVDASRLRVFDHAGTPCVAGWWRPVIAVPAAAFQTLTHRQWQWVLRHEEEHIRGGDMGISWLFGLIKAVAWWNPFVHGLIECWARAREEVCDAAAVQKTQVHSAYADFLLTVASSGKPTVTGAMPISQSKPARRLRARLEALLAGRVVRERAGWWFHLACVVLILLGHTLLASFGLASSAQAAEPASPVARVADDDGAMFTRVYHVPASFGGGTEVRTFFEQKGVSFPGNASVTFNKAARQVIARNTRANLEAISRIVTAASVGPVQIHFSGKIIEADKYFGVNGEVLSGAAFEALIREASQKKGIHLLSAPAVTTKLAQRATVEVTRQKEGESGGKFVGLRLQLNCKALQGKKAAVSVKTELRLDMSQKQLLPPQPSEQIDWTQVEVFSAEAEAGLASGETQVMHMAAGARRMTVLVTAKAIRPDGSVAGDFDEKVSTLPPPRPGDDDALPAEAYEREVQRASEVEAAEARKQIYLSVKVVEVNSPEARQSIGYLSPPPAAQGAVPAKGIYVVSGVLTNPQFEVTLRNLSRQKGVKLTPLANQAVRSEQEATFDLPESVGGGKLQIMPARDSTRGGMIDLLIRTPHTGGPDQDSSTAVTVWDGQTVVLGGTGFGENKDQPARFIFITSAMIETIGRPESK
ncbi:MAG TPA: M56 family metallopeptidase [Prosthecobacter sp.]|nr:M56 family metallopeptidase [Prosthecobacter sp.]